MGNDVCKLPPEPQRETPQPLKHSKLQDVVVLDDEVDLKLDDQSLLDKTQKEEAIPIDKGKIKKNPSMEKLKNVARKSLDSFTKLGSVIESTHFDTMPVKCIYGSN
ncbi:hypothetical protein EIN_251190 [Entamoeba invadens IP1]|uniref:Uncharacterized protein n=1 Tax=Entamoeba invadens IP1 TaxID=370355 RepID=A0A0A1UEG8_ENTIV|nr:hypothetical protein EIN_251190 [Entamoeba invadens IP1]ELP94975.1 hypothetical protein EIN_251190 [Entamoeba invadens IP1]|eukprot:XP_004261746.1 hypothetical protein EIN_251190 [Entamoeba invadens IP1]